MPTTGPILTVQTATLSSTTDTDLFSGTGGPFAYDPFFGGFAGIVSSQGIFGEPFHDQLKGVDASKRRLEAAYRPGPCYGRLPVLERELVST